MLTPEILNLQEDINGLIIMIDIAANTHSVCVLKLTPKFINEKVKLILMILLIESGWSRMRIRLIAELALSPLGTLFIAITSKSFHSRSELVPIVRDYSPQMVWFLGLV